MLYEVITLESRIHELIIADNGRDAWNAYRDARPDAIISNVNLPESNGLELLKKIRQENSYIPFILFSEVVNPDLMIEATHYQVTAFLTKPLRNNFV